MLIREGQLLTFDSSESWSHGCGPPQSEAEVHFGKPRASINVGHGREVTQSSDIAGSSCQRMERSIRLLLPMRPPRRCDGVKTTQS